MGNAGSGSSGSRGAGKLDEVMPSSPSRDEPAFLFDKKPRSSLVYQTSNDDEEPLYTKHKEASESCDIGGGGVGGRHRSATISEGAAIGDSPKVLPTVFKWDGGGKQVLISGTFSNWKSIPMVKSHGDFVTIIDLPEGEHQYKFLVDGEWKHDPSAKIIDDEVGTSKNNLISVKNSDFEVFRALDCDSQPANDSSAENGIQEYLDFWNMIIEWQRGQMSTWKKDGYSQDVPIGKPWEKPSGPPILPPHLLQVILNQDTPISCEPTLLPEPNHVMLNHLYALSIKDGVMVLSATHRYRKKYVTTLLYKPI